MGRTSRRRTTHWNSFRIRINNALVGLARGNTGVAGLATDTRLTRLVGRLMFQSTAQARGGKRTSSSAVQADATQNALVGLASGNTGVAGLATDTRLGSVFKNTAQTRGGKRTSSSAVQSDARMLQRRRRKPNPGSALRRRPRRRRGPPRRRTRRQRRLPRRRPRRRRVPRKRSRPPRQPTSASGLPRLKSWPRKRQRRRRPQRVKRALVGLAHGKDFLAGHVRAMATVPTMKEK